MVSFHRRFTDVPEEPSRPGSLRHRQSLGQGVQPVGDVAAGRT